MNIEASVTLGVTVVLVKNASGLGCRDHKAQQNMSLGSIPLPATVDDDG